MNSDRYRWLNSLQLKINRCRKALAKLGSYFTYQLRTKSEDLKFLIETVE